MTAHDMPHDSAGTRSSQLSVIVDTLKDHNILKSYLLYMIKMYLSWMLVCVWTHMTTYFVLLLMLLLTVDKQ